MSPALPPEISSKLQKANIIVKVLQVAATFATDNLLPYCPEWLVKVLKSGRKFHLWFKKDGPSL
jgi:hypothetical protein